MRRLSVYCQQVEPGKLRVTDLTPIDEDYPALENIRYWQFSLLRLGKVILQATTEDARSGDWYIDAADYGIGTAFVSDVYEVLLEVMGEAVGVQRLANYFVRTKLREGERVWLSFNGGYFDMTGSGEVIDGDWVWNIMQTYDSYERVKIRTADGRDVRTEDVVADVLQESTYLDTKRMVSLLSASEMRIFCRTDRQAWAKLMHGQVRRWMGRVGREAVRYRAFVAPDDQEERLQTAGAYLDLLEEGFITEPGVARDLLTLAQNTIRSCSH